jgi:hypothetical protein
VHEALAPSHMSLKIDDRLVKLDSQQGEFLLFAVIFAVLHKRFNDRFPGLAPINAVALAEMIALLPDGIVSGYRKKRTYISGLMSKNEANSSNPYCRKLFMRVRQGWYVVNPKVAVLHKDEWIDIYRHAGIDLIAHMWPEGSDAYHARIQPLLTRGAFST